MISLFKLVLEKSLRWCGVMALVIWHVLTLA